MNKHLTVLAVALLLTVSVRAQFLGTTYYTPVLKGDTAGWRELYHAKAEQPISVFGGASYAYNKTYGHYGEFAIGAQIPVNRTFEVLLAAQLTTANTYYFTGTLRQLYPLPEGELFTEEILNDRIYNRSGVNNFSVAFGAGYRQNYVSITLGYAAQVMTPLNHYWHQQTDGSVVEPYNGYYRLEVYCRPQRNPWNISIAITNYNTFLIERICEPWLILNSHYDVNAHCRLHFGVEIKEAGWFHTACEWWGATAAAGFEYRF